MQEWIALSIVGLVLVRLVWWMIRTPLYTFLAYYFLKKGKVSLAMRFKSLSLGRPIS